MPKTEGRDTCAAIRAAVSVARQQRPAAAFVTGSANGWETEDGHVASGRAACLCCGQKIAKDEPCLRAVYVGGELWTAPVRFLHASEC